MGVVGIWIGVTGSWLPVLGSCRLATRLSNRYASQGRRSFPGSGNPRCRYPGTGHCLYSGRSELITAYTALRITFLNDLLVASNCGYPTPIATQRPCHWHLLASASRSSTAWAGSDIKARYPHTCHRGHATVFSE